MDYMTHSEKRTIDGRELHFIRCDKNGVVLTPQELGALSVTNSTIEALVTEVSARIGSVEDGVSISTQ